MTTKTLNIAQRTLAGLMTITVLAGCEGGNGVRAVAPAAKNSAPNSKTGVNHGSPSDSSSIELESDSAQNRRLEKALLKLQAQEKILGAVNFSDVSNDLFNSGGSSRETIPLITGDGKALITEQQIKSLFDGIVKTDPPATVQIEVQVMTSFADGYQKLVSSQAGNTDYNHAMGEYFLMLFAQNCPSWSGSDYSSCPKEKTDRDRLSQEHQKNYEALKVKYQADFDLLVKQNKKYLAIRSEIEALN